MNEYQDQSEWFELLVLDGHGVWVVISDHDSREAAESAKLPPWARDSDVRRRRGLPA